MSLFRSPMLRTSAKMLAVAVGIKVANPYLDQLILPKDDDDTEHRSARFEPDRTDVRNYPALKFVKSNIVIDEDQTAHITQSSLLNELLPKWLSYLLKPYIPVSSFHDDFFETVPMDILDARKRQAMLNFGKCGFTLLNMVQPSKTANWRSQSDIERHFQQEIYEQLMELHPGATRIEFTHAVVRGGNQFGDHPVALDSLHLDFSQDDQARKTLHETYPVNTREQEALTGRLDTDEEEVRKVIGVWKPIHMSGQPVYDHPLAVMDASTFQPSQERPFHLYLDLVGFTLHNLNAVLIANPKQKLYYYPYQTEEEILVFTQYSKGKFHCNPHSSFLVPNRPEKYETRQSIEMRAAVFYPRNHK